MDANFSPWSKRFAAITRGIVFLIGLMAFAHPTPAQEQQQQRSCVSAERIEALRSEIASEKERQPDPALRAEILEMKSALVARSMRQAAAARGGPETSRSDPKTEELTQKSPSRICDILNSQPWPTKSVVGSDGASAWIGLIRNYLPVAAQFALMPVISAGVDKNAIEKEGELAALVDRLRLSTGQAQVFGTQASASENGFLVLAPLQSEDRVDAWRKDYNLPPLRDYIRSLQVIFRMPMIRSTVRPHRVDAGPPTQENSVPDRAGDLLKSDADDEVVRVETSLVTIDATVYSPGTAEPPALAKENFKIYEDGQEQEISAYSSAESPFDIVLLLDLSGSTADKIGLIKKTTKRFVEMKRSVDRVAIVTFSGKQTIVSPLESDKAKLLDSIGRIKDYGSSKVWDAIGFAVDLLERESPAGRRKGVVAMTDGADNALWFTPGTGSAILFADLLEEVRKGSIAVFPIYLDTQGPTEIDKRIYADARRTLQLLADDSGGNFYAAKDIGNLNQVYERVLRDVGRVYSLGYEPKNARRDGAWRSIRVEIPGRPEVKVRARSGYYAK